MEENKMWEATQWFILESYTKEERKWWAAYFRNHGLSPGILDKDDEILRKLSLDKNEAITSDRVEKMQKPKLECKRCGGKWEQRGKKPPIQCPKCKSPYWDKDRKK